jgi:hypothetical protein
MSTSRGIRNNNPGNIRKSNADWEGKVSGSDSAFETFDTPENGIRALAKTLVSYQERHGCATINQIIARWAPPVENETYAYQKAVQAAVSETCGETIARDAPIDVHDYRIMRGLVAGIVQHENGRQPYDKGTIDAGIKAAGIKLRAAPKVERTREVVTAELHELLERQKQLLAELNLLPPPPVPEPAKDAGEQPAAEPPAQPDSQPGAEHQVV